MISVITPTIRPEGLKVVSQALAKQTFKEFEWLIGSPFDPNYLEAKWIKDDFKGGYWSLNRIYNKLIKEAKGELIVSLQDWIYIEQDGLEKLWNNYQQSHGIVTGVGDQYETINKWGKPHIKIWSDPRKTTHYGSFYEINPSDCEWNFCAVPKKALYEVGGFDEEMDFLGYGMDGYQVNERMDAKGWRFYIDQTNESYTVRHTRDDFGGQEEWDKHNNLTNGNYEKRRAELINSNKWPCIGYI